MECFELADAGGFNAIVLNCIGFIQSANCSFDDGRPPIVPCECTRTELSLAQAQNSC